jgi:predicted 3-demethylubiquinone-9 3-methyltransferase (glyoxalase superfamily)
MYWSSLETGLGRVYRALSHVDEINHYWGTLSAQAKAEACGWLKDKFGLSWQTVPELMKQSAATLRVCFQ